MFCRFTTDNGGPAAGFNLNAASNWPLKGVSALFSISTQIVYLMILKSEIIRSKIHYGKGV